MKEGNKKSTFGEIEQHVDGTEWWNKVLFELDDKVCIVGTTLMHGNKVMIPSEHPKVLTKATLEKILKAMNDYE